MNRMWITVKHHLFVCVCVCVCVWRELLNVFLNREVTEFWMSVKSLLGCVEDGWKDKAEFKETSQQPLFFFFLVEIFEKLTEWSVLKVQETMRINASA